MLSVPYRPPEADGERTTGGMALMLALAKAFRSKFSHSEKRALPKMCWFPVLGDLRNIQKCLKVLADGLTNMYCIFRAHVLGERHNISPN